MGFLLEIDKNIAYVVAFLDLFPDFVQNGSFYFFRGNQGGS